MQRSRVESGLFQGDGEGVRRPPLDFGERRRWWRQVGRGALPVRLLRGRARPRKSSGSRFDVVGERPVVDVTEVEAPVLFEGAVRSPGDLPEAGEAGLDPQSLAGLLVPLAASSGSAGRGPTMLIVPRSTQTSCGSSSMESLRRRRPTRVTRGSSVILKSGPSASLRSSSDSFVVLCIDDHRAQFPSARTSGRRGRPVPDGRAPARRDSSLMAMAATSSTGALSNNIVDRQPDVEATFCHRSPAAAYDRFDVHHRATVERLRSQPCDVDVMEQRRQRDVVSRISQASRHHVDGVCRNRAERHHHTVCRRCAREFRRVRRTCPAPRPNHERRSRQGRPFR